MSSSAGWNVNVRRIAKLDADRTPLTRLPYKRHSDNLTRNYLIFRFPRGLPLTQRFGLPFALRFGLPFALRFSLSFALRFSLPFALRFSLPFALRFSFPFALRFSFPFALRFSFSVALFLKLAHRFSYDLVGPALAVDDVVCRLIESLLNILHDLSHRIGA